MAEPLSREMTLAPPEPEPGFAARRLRSSLPAALRPHLRSARELARELQEAAEADAFPTAVPAFDRLLDGGLPRGQLVELIGGRTSGRFSAILAALAAATSVDEAAALVDLGDGLDPATALALGIDLERLLWARPATLKKALAAAEMLIDGGFPLVALDLGNPPVRGGRGIEAAWLRLARAARAHGSVLLVGAPYRVSGTAAGVVLAAGRGRAAWQGGGGSPWLLAGIASRIAVDKHRGRLAGRSEELALAMAGVVLKTAAPQPEVVGERHRLRPEASPPGPLSLTGEGERSRSVLPFSPSPVRERGPGGEASGADLFACL